jgi:hypothetical protein
MDRNRMGAGVTKILGWWIKVVTANGCGRSRRGNAPAENEVPVLVREQIAVFGLCLSPSSTMTLVGPNPAAREPHERG